MDRHTTLIIMTYTLRTQRRQAAQPVVTGEEDFAQMVVTTSVVIGATEVATTN